MANLRKIVFSLLEVSLNFRLYFKYLRKAKVFSLSSVQLVESISKYCDPIETVIDVGANKGQFLFSSLVKYPNAKFYSFEPLNDLYITLKSKTADLKNCEVLNYALGQKIEESIFYEHKYSHISSILEVKQDNQNPKYIENDFKKTTVLLNTIDNIFKDAVLKSRVLLKIDAQGFEQEILLGGLNTLPNIDYVLFETSFEELYNGQKLFPEIHSFLTQNGFTLVAPMNFHRGANDSIIEMDILYKNIAK